MVKILIIEDDEIMAECLARAAKSALAPADSQCTIFNNAISALYSLNEEVPDLILLDILLVGPNGFSFLNELISYSDTATIPIIIVTSLDLHLPDLQSYGVRAILSKETMTPTLIGQTVREVLHAQ